MWLSLVWLSWMSYVSWPNFLGCVRIELGTILVHADFYLFFQFMNLFNEFIDFTIWVHIRAYLSGLIELFGLCLLIRGAENWWVMLGLNWLLPRSMLISNYFNNPIHDLFVYSLILSSGFVYVCISLVWLSWMSYVCWPNLVGCVRIGLGTILVHADFYLFSNLWIYLMSSLILPCEFIYVHISLVWLSYLGCVCWPEVLKLGGLC